MAPEDAGRAAAGASRAGWSWPGVLGVRDRLMELGRADRGRGIGIGWCFVANAVSFTFVIASLLSLDVSALHEVTPVPRGRGELREGLRYAAHVPAIAGPLLMMALIGTFTFEFEVSLPLLARITFHGGATAYSWLIGAVGAGAVAGGPYAARSARTGVQRLTWAALGLAIAVGLLAAGPRYALALGAAGCLAAVVVGRRTPNPV